MLHQTKSLVIVKSYCVVVVCNEGLILCLSGWPLTNSADYLRLQIIEVGGKESIIYKFMMFVTLTKESTICCMQTSFIAMAPPYIISFELN